MLETNEVTPAHLSRSVIAVPPLARNADLGSDREGNRRIIAHLVAGGVTTMLYGGNANFYNVSVAEFAGLVDELAEVAPAECWIIPSIGPDFGKSLDQVALLRDRTFPTAMVLPLRFPVTTAGVATGLRKLADAYGRPIIAYVKSTDYVTPDDLARLAADGAICAIKYAVVRDDPAVDPYLDELVDKVDRSLIVSGMGERPVITHRLEYRLNGFTSGSVCVAPAMSNGILEALAAGDGKRAERLRAHFIALEDLRDGHSPLRVLHAAVQLAGIAETGPLTPFLSGITDAALLGRIETAAKALLAADTAYAKGELLEPAL